MNAYKKIILSLSLLTLVTPVENTCTNQLHTCGGYIHRPGIGVAVLGGITWITWNVLTSITENPWQSIDKETFFRSTLSATLTGAFIVGAALSLLCCSDEEECEGPNTSLWMAAGGSLGYLYGAIRHSQYSTPEYALNQAKELAKYMWCNSMLWDAEKSQRKFLARVKHSYKDFSYPLVTGHLFYKELKRKLSCIIEYLDKTLENGASEDQMITIRDIRKETKANIRLTEKALSNIRNTGEYHRQLEAKKRDQIRKNEEYARNAHMYY